MGRRKKAEPATTNIKVRESARAILASWRDHWKLEGMSDAIEEMHKRQFKTTAPLAGKERE